MTGLSSYQVGSENSILSLMYTYCSCLTCIIFRQEKSLRFHGAGGGGGGGNFTIFINDSLLKWDQLSFKENTCFPLRANSFKNNK